MSDSESQPPVRQPRRPFDDELIRAIRTVLRLIPYGIGAALDVQIFDRIAARDAERMQAFIEELSRRIESLDAQQASLLRKDFLDTDEFRYILREVLWRAAREHRQAKIDAFHAVLVNSMMKNPALHFDRKVFFLEVLDALTVDHIHLLKHLHRQRAVLGVTERESVSTIWELFHAKDDTTRRYVYSGLDTLANRQLIAVGPIPLVLDRRVDTVTSDPDEPGAVEFRSIDQSRQSYAITDLGIAFVAFITLQRINELIQ